MPTGQQPAYFQECVSPGDQRREKVAPSRAENCPEVQVSSFCFLQLSHSSHGLNVVRTANFTNKPPGDIKKSDMSYLWRCSGLRLSGRPDKRKRDCLLHQQTEGDNRLVLIWLHLYSRCSVPSNRLKNPKEKEMLIKELKHTSRRSLTCLLKEFNVLHLVIVYRAEAPSGGPPRDPAA